MSKSFDSVFVQFIVRNADGSFNKPESVARVTQEFSNWFSNMQEDYREVHSILVATLKNQERPTPLPKLIEHVSQTMRDKRKISDMVKSYVAESGHFVSVVGKKGGVKLRGQTG